jgi:hypothetical protein
MRVPSFGTSSNHRASDELRNRRTQYEGPRFERPEGRHHRRSRSIVMQDPKSRDSQMNYAFPSEV